MPKRIWKEEKSRGNGPVIDKELIRHLRTKLMVSNPELKVVAITSSEPGEGKTTIALRLTDALQAVGRKAILVDGSLRKVSIANKTLAASALGLSTYLRGSHSVNDLLGGKTPGGADIILNTEPAENSTELLEGSRFDQLIGKLRNEYDYVILDTPAISGCTDAVVISKSADAVVQIVEAGRVSGDKVRKDISFLEETKTPVIGIVLNKTD